VKDREDGLTLSVGGGGGETVRLTLTVRATPPAGVTVKLPLYPPSERPEGFTETLRLEGVEPLVGETEIHEALGWPVLKDREPQVLVRETDCADGNDDPR
jgi:hypothetical protein